MAESVMVFGRTPREPCGQPVGTLIDTCWVYVFMHQTGVDQGLVADGLRERLGGRRGVVLRSRRV
jgi:hypothetical protein